MTNREAIKELMDDIAMYDNEIVRLNMAIGTPDRNMIDALEMGIEALEKQIPKRVIHRNTMHTQYNSPWSCPNCEADLSKVEFFSFGGGEANNRCSYCWHCGQAIDWTED